MREFHVGEEVTVTGKQFKYTGIVMPSPEGKVLVLKLKNGYNLGITKDKETQAQRVEEKESTKHDAKKAEKFFSLTKGVKPVTADDTDTQLQVPVISKPMPSEITLDEYQKAALEGLRPQQYGCLIGAAGTGKTTVTKQLVAEISGDIPTIDLNYTKIKHTPDEKPDYNVAICFCAFTGRAVQQMKKALPEEYHPMCNTVHATLGYQPERQEYLDEDTNTWKEKLIFRPTFTAENKLPYKVCIVDEAGMLAINLWDELIAALPDDCRIILIGDINQLPPVQGRSVLGFAMTRWPTYTLEKIHRQAADNPIIANAHKILKGHFPQQEGKKFVIRPMPDGGVATLHETKNIIKYFKVI